jgi:hypothetical protein
MIGLCDSIEKRSTKNITMYKNVPNVGNIRVSNKGDVEEYNDTSVRYAHTGFRVSGEKRGCRTHYGVRMCGTARPCDNLLGHIVRVNGGYAYNSMRCVS